MQVPLLAAVAAAAAWFGAVDALAPSRSLVVGDKSYGYVGGVATVADDVPVLYDNGKRPVFFSEWPAIIEASTQNVAGDGLAFAVGFGGSAAIWDDSTGNFATVDTNDPTAPLVPLATTDANPGFLALENGNLDCNPSRSSPVNVVDSYPGITYADNVIDACMCFSSFSGTTCGDDTAVTCNNTAVSSDTANTGQQVIRNGTDGGVINPLMETVEFTIDSPQVNTRKYKSFSWGTCKAGGDYTNTALRMFQSSGSVDSCQDSFAFGWMVSQLVSVCGLQEGNFEYDGTKEGRANNSWVRYRGDLMINYVETVTLSVNGGSDTKSLTRTGRLVTPIDVYILRTYTAELSAETTIQVTSQFQLRAAITATEVKANATTATVDITFGTSKPYEIVYISNEYPGLGGSNVPGVQWVGIGDVAPINAAYIVDDNGVVVNGPTVTQSSNAGLGACVGGDYDAQGFCWRTIRILIITDTACTLNHRFTLNTIAIGCNPQYQGADCPLAAVDTTSQAQFTVTAADYCDGQRAMVINGAVVIKAYVPQASLSRTDTTPLRAFVVNSNAFLTLFIDAERSLKVFNLTPTKFETKLGESGTYTAPTNAASYISASSFIANGAGDQGFDVATQTHAMQVSLDCNFVLDVDGQTCLLAPGTNGNDVTQEIYARLTFNVDYENAAPPQSASRRRRRQADNTQTGYASVDASSTVESDGSTSAEAAPSSAAGLYTSSTLVALVLASLVAVLLH